MRSGNPLLGTWRLVSYETWNAAGDVSQPLGAPPAGYAVFDATGHAFIQLAQGSAHGARADDVAKSFMAYFGTFTVDDENTEITIFVEASNAPSYVGSLQVRPFQIRGDMLVLGILGQYRATLHRAAA